MSKRKRRSTKGRDLAVHQTGVTQPARSGPVQGVIAPAGNQQNTISDTSSHQPSQWSQSTMRKIGPCFRCAAWGHLQKNCPKVAKLSFLCGMIRSNIDLVDTGNKETSVVIENKEFNLVDLPGYLGTNNRSDGYFDPQEADNLSLCDPLVGRCWEASDSSSDLNGKQILDVQGRLKAAAQFWEEVLHAKLPVMYWIREGYKLPLLKVRLTTNQPWTIVSMYLKDLLKNRCIQEVSTRPHICSPLSVITNEMGKQWLVINLRHLNQYLWKDHFKYEDLLYVL